MFSPQVIALVRDRRWTDVEALCRDMLAHEPDDVPFLRLIGLALERMAESGTSIPEAYRRFYPQLSDERRLLVASLRAYSRAVKRSSRSDEIAVAGRARLRATLGYHYESRCWRCHDPLSDAPGDNHGKCSECGWFRCSLCDACGCEYAPG